MILVDYLERLAAEVAHKTKTGVKFDHFFIDPTPAEFRACRDGARGVMAVSAGQPHLFIFSGRWYNHEQGMGVLAQEGVLDAFSGPRDVPHDFWMPRMHDYLLCVTRDWGYGVWGPSDSYNLLAAGVVAPFQERIEKWYRGCGLVEAGGVWEYGGEQFIATANVETFAFEKRMDALKIKNVNEAFLDYREFRNGPHAVFVDPTAEELRECGAGARGVITKDTGNKTRLFMVPRPAFATHFDIIEILFETGAIKPWQNMRDWWLRRELNKGVCVQSSERDPLRLGFAESYPASWIKNADPDFVGNTRNWLNEAGFIEGEDGVWKMGRIEFEFKAAYDVGFVPRSIEDRLAGVGESFVDTFRMFGNPAEIFIDPTSEELDEIGAARAVVAKAKDGNVHLWAVAPQRTTHTELVRLLIDEDMIESKKSWEQWSTTDTKTCMCLQAHKFGARWLWAYAESYGIRDISRDEAMIRWLERAGFEYKSVVTDGDTEDGDAVWWMQKGRQRFLPFKITHPRELEDAAADIDYFVGAA